MINKSVFSPVGLTYRASRVLGKKPNKLRRTLASLRSTVLFSSVTLHTLIQTKAAPHTHIHTTLTCMLREGANRPAFQTTEDSVDASLLTLTFRVPITTNLLTDLNMGNGERCKLKAEIPLV